jgi:HlyD family secretion protein
MQELVDVVPNRKQYWGYPLVQLEKQNRAWARWPVVLCLLAAVIAAAFWLFRRPKLVVIVPPKRVSLTETIASSARVGGVQESAIGAQFSGTVEHLFVKIGDHVNAGQLLATLKNNVTQQQKAQARTAVETGRARLAQASKAPLRSEVDEAVHQVAEGKAQVTQADADLQRATKQFERSQQLLREGLVARSEFDTAQSNQESLRSRLEAAKATVKVREAKLETLKNTPHAEDVQVARAQLAEAQQALQVADEQSKEATVTAPFAGVVTAVNAEQGQTVGANGVVNLVSEGLEIRVDLDESNLADLELGQSAILTSSAFGSKSFQGRLTDIGAAVDQARGIVTVKITPDNPPDWLRPGQTVNVNLVTNEKADRLVVPSTAVLRQGSRSVVLLVEGGRVVDKAVITRPAVAAGIPISSGVTETDQVIVDPVGVTAGQTVRVKRQGE